MALDIGSRTIGVALSDPLKITARPLMTIRRTSIDRDYQALLSVASEFHVDRIILGHPAHQDGSESDVMKHIGPLAERLRLDSGLKVDWQDERLSTREAEQLMSLHRVPVVQRRKKRNEYAAAVILEWYLKECGSLL